ncbi:OLC1v1037343C1 [Oldenlandia corymbosa var. corymbosa]|uniref:OLC1v1037343C1 n=1 Tax=Oldenlandia corymbosa var. corymbosa TaxID=529605 RepID=A0AAV1D0K1_OLDCO|nr:OLC1v1037343C1 [Oldenlandia corymbosa var. corymbosa]
MDESVHQKHLKVPQISVQNPDSKDYLICNLPDSVLCHILSFLPTKFAVGTSILSTRWKNLFTLIPKLKLDFDDSLLLRNPNGEPNPVADSDSEEEHGSSFLDFVGRVLNRLLENGATISLFKLTCRQKYKSDDIVSCVGAAVRLRVEYISLHAHLKISSASKLFGALNGCTTLTWLWLSLGKAFFLFLLEDIPVVKFPNLKRLTIDHAMLFGGVELLLNECPVLEHLTLARCVIEPVQAFRIRFGSLKNLVLRFCIFHPDTIVVIDTPLLECLYKYGCSDVNFSFISKFERINRLALLLGVLDDEGPNDLKIAGLINACSEVENLNLFGPTTEVLHHLPLPLPNFCNLKTLLLNVVGVAGWNFFGRLLKNASKVESVWIDSKSDMVDGCFVCFQKSANGIPHCLTSSMKMVEIRAFKGHEDEIKFIEYLLENGKVLEKVVFDCDFDWKKNSDVFKRIFEAEVKSETCKIVFQSTLSMRLRAMCSCRTVSSWGY